MPIGHFKRKPCSEETRIKMSIAKMGHKGYMLGKHHSEESKRKMRLGNIGKHRSEETKLRIKLAKIGKYASEETKRKMSESGMGHIGYMLGKHHSIETKTKMRNSQIGKSRKGHIAWNKNRKMDFPPKSAFKKGHRPWNYRGTSSKEKDRIRSSSEFKLWRDSVFQRDKFLCQMPDCDKSERYLNGHHIKKFADYPELRFEVSNGITLCKKCHDKVQWKEEKYENMFIEIVRLRF